MMEDLEKIPEHDVIDEELLNMLHALVGEDADEEQLDAASNLLFSLIEQLVDDEEIKEIPDTEEDETSKKEWLEQSLPILKESFQALLKDLSSDELDILSSVEQEEIV